MNDNKLKEKFYIIEKLLFLHEAGLSILPRHQRKTLQQQYENIQKTFINDIQKQLIKQLEELNSN